MHEGVEVAEDPREYRDNPLVTPVSVTISILAVFVAAVTLLGHRAHTEELLKQSQATDQWAYYQAKNIRSHEMQSVADILSVLAPGDKDKAEAMRQKYLKEMSRYQDDKNDISGKARELENERDVISRRADRFDGGEALLEIGLVICSITLVTKRRLFWYSGVFIGICGLGVGLTGFLVH
jgi:hypothetical protein